MLTVEPNSTIEDTENIVNILNITYNNSDINYFIAYVSQLYFGHK